MGRRSRASEGARNAWKACRERATIEAATAATAANDADYVPSNEEFLLTDIGNDTAADKYLSGGPSLLITHTTQNPSMKRTQMNL